MSDTQLAAAAALLVEIAGPEPVQIEMAARGPKKYYELHHRLSEQDARAHLAGRSTRGATLRYPGGMTRALCYDADIPDDWLRLLEAAYRLAACGYLPLLEASPVGRGGHLWIIYTGLVPAACAQGHAAQVAPTLQRIEERWPGPGAHKVRLPGGVYVRPQVRAWCQLYDEQGRLLSADGPGAARVLLEKQTPAELVPVCLAAEPGEHISGNLVGLPTNSGGEQCARPGPLPDQEYQAEASTRTAHSKAQRQPWGDARWQQKYGRALWFEFTPVQLAAWYNARHQVEEILPPEKNGMGLATWRGERTASVGLRAEGWVDFGASARRTDGKQDGGDALELTVRVTQEAKPEVMQKLARQLVREAREAMESAAWRGDQPPTWVQRFMTPAGWQRYHALRAEAAYATNTWGVAGFHNPSEHTQTSTERTNQGPRQLQKSEQAGLPESNDRARKDGNV